MSWAGDLSAAWAESQIWETSFLLTKPAVGEVKVTSPSGVKGVI